MVQPLTVRDAATVSGRNPETVRRWIWQGKLPAKKLGNQLFIDRKDLDALLDPSTKRSQHLAEFIARARALREDIYGRTGKLFDVEELVERSRAGHLE